jgi:hypothetical protein
MNLFIIGSGFTKALFPNAPLNSDLLPELYENRANTGCQKLFDRYKINDIEICLTKLDLDIISNKAKVDELNSLRTNVENELADFFYDYVASDDLLINYGWARKFFQNAISADDVVVSLNYDCVFEGMLDLVDKWTPNGGYGTTLNNDALYPKRETRTSPISVLKIHGSANFYKKLALPPVVGPRAKGIDFIFSKHFFPKSGRKEYPDGEVENEPYIIAPSFVKTHALVSNYLMLQALNASSKATYMIVIGCGMRPEDSFLTLLITSFLNSSNRKNGKLLIIDRDSEKIYSKIQRYYETSVSKDVLCIDGFIQHTVDDLIEKVK